MPTLTAATPMAFVHIIDANKALAFYRDTLGLTVTDTDDYGYVLDLGGAALRLTVIPDHKPHPHPVLGWSVSDIAAAAQDLAAKGVVMLRYDFLEQDEAGVWHSEDGKTHLAYFADPDGNCLSLVQE